MKTSLMVRGSFWSLELDSSLRGRELLTHFLGESRLTLYHIDSISLGLGVLEKDLLSDLTKPLQLLLSSTYPLGDFNASSIDALQLEFDVAVVGFVFVP